MSEDLDQTLRYPSTFSFWTETRAEIIGDSHPALSVGLLSMNLDQIQQIGTGTTARNNLGVFE